VAGTDFGCGFMAGANLAGIQGSPATWPQQYPAGWIGAGGQFVGPGVTLSGSFVGVDFRGANLSGVHFSRPNLSWANFSGVNLTGAIFGGNIWNQNTGFSGANLTNATFSYTYFQSADFTGANFAGADFTGAQFAASTFVNANFTKAIFRDTVAFWGSTVSGANFTGASAPFGVLKKEPNPNAVVFPSIWGVGTTGTGVICGPGVVTDDWSTCFPPPPRAIHFPPAAPSARR
jgi:uncharacterized protein YjbI with pentapeptide repeats